MQTPSTRKRIWNIGKLLWKVQTRWTSDGNASSFPFAASKISLAVMLTCNGGFKPIYLLSKIAQTLLRIKYAPTRRAITAFISHCLLVIARYGSWSAYATLSIMRFYFLLQTNHLTRPYPHVSLLRPIDAVLSALLIGAIVLKQKQRILHSNCLYSHYCLGILFFQKLILATFYQPLYYQKVSRL
jgi:hypothetical protein